MKKRVWMLLGSIMLILGISVGITLAYFTAFSTEAGTQELVLGTDTTIHETVTDLNKSVTITNEGGAPVFVRVKAFYPQAEGLEVAVIAGEGWSAAAEGWYQYQLPLAAGETTASSVEIEVTVSEKLEKEFNIVVVHEAVAALYTEEGEAYADWNMRLAAEGEEN